MMFVQGLLLIVVLNVQIAAAFAPVGSARITVVGAVQNKFRAATTTAKPVLWPLFYRNSKNETSIGIVTNDHSPPIHRFERTASQARQIDEPCILTIDNIRYNVTAWAKAHPGGVAVLKKFNDKDATKAFHAAHHSAAAVEMLKDFAIVEQQQEKSEAIALDNGNSERSSRSTAITPPLSSMQKTKAPPRWRAKLFTKEDPIGVHKYLGVFVLLHFAFRFFQMFFTDPSAGLGTRMGRGPSWIPVACLLPHGLLSVSSLIFHTVPKDRVVGKPMIWQEFRVHNIAFGLRSIVSAALCSVAIHGGNTPALRQMAVWGTSAACLAAIVAADLGTKYLRSDQLESTTATMPYWEGCSVATQKRFKSFYAYCQFLATLGCLSVTNPAFPLAILLAIQLASLFMTLVRKGLLSTRGYHLGYTAALIAPYAVALRSMIVSMKSPDVLFLFALGGVMFQLRRRGVNKYALWLPVIAARIAVGDRYLNYNAW